jgi:hypothetical protein
MVPGYAGFEPYEISWEDFCAPGVPGLIKDNIKVGVNWSGKRAVGYDIEAKKVREYVEAIIKTPH